MLTDAARIALADAASSFSADFRFLGVATRIAADDPAVTDLFAGMYARFRTDDLTDPRVFQVVVRPPDGVPYVRYEGRVQPLLVGELTISHAYMYVLNRVLAQVADVWMLHAGSVAGPRGGRLFLGGPGFGKTTLILALVRRGHALYSDEFACVDRETGLLHPFPRALGLREGAVALFPDLAALPRTRVKNLGRGVKDLLDPLTIPGARVAAPAPIAEVFVLSAGDDGDGEARVDVAHRHDAEAWQGRLLAVPGVALEGESAPDGLRVARYRVAAEAMTGFTELCVAADQAILYHERVYGRRPDFAAAPRLLPIRKSEVATLLLQGLRNREGCFGDADGFRRAAARTFLDLAGWLKPARCARLVVGRLDETVALVESAAGEA